jgi:CRP-like cAMP-binding protein
LLALLTLEESQVKGDSELKPVSTTEYQIEARRTMTTMPLLIDTLQENVFYHEPANRKEVRELAALFIIRNYPRGKILVSAGEIWDKVFFIHQGIIRFFYSDNEGREFNKGFFQEGELAWPVAPYARSDPSLFNIAAMEDVRISSCGFERFHLWLKHHGYWEKFALPYAESIAADKFLREYEFLVNSATERFEKFLINNPGLAKRIPDYHLASYLGITNVSLSRIKRRRILT